MAFKSYNVGLGNVGSYQVAGVPWVSGSLIPPHQEIIFRFPTVTRSVTVMHTGSYGNVLISFVPTASMDPVANCYWELSGSQTANSTLGLRYDKMTMNVKCSKIHISNDTDQASGARVFAELTGIPPARMYSLTGSGISENTFEM